MNADVENQEDQVMADGGDPEAEERKRKTWLLCKIVLFAVLFAVFFGACLQLSVRRPRYYVAISSISDLADVHATAPDPTFNLTLRVASNNFIDSACVAQDTFVQVAYRGVALAGNTVGRLCAGPRMATERPVLATGDGVRTVRVPGGVMNELVEEMRRGAAVFDVLLMLPDPADQYGRNLVRKCRVPAAATATAAPSMCTNDLYWMYMYQ